MRVSRIQAPAVKAPTSKAIGRVCFDLETELFSEDFRRARTTCERIRHAPEMLVGCVYFQATSITMLSRITEFRVESCLAKRTTSGGSYQPRLDRSQCRFPRHTGSFFLSAGGSAAQTGRPRTIAPGGGGILSMTGLRNGQSPNRFYHAGKIVQWQNDLGSIAHNAWRLVEL